MFDEISQQNEFPEKNLKARLVWHRFSCGYKWADIEVARPTSFAISTSRARMERTFLELANDNIAASPLCSNPSARRKAKINLIQQRRLTTQKRPNYLLCWLLKAFHNKAIVSTGESAGRQMRCILNTVFIFEIERIITLCQTNHRSSI